MNIQNSLLLLSSSFNGAVIFLLLINNITKAGTTNAATKSPIMILMALPASVNACTEVSPSTPVLVRKVEYNINPKLRNMKK